MEISADIILRKRHFYILMWKGLRNMQLLNERRKLYAKDAV